VTRPPSVNDEIQDEGRIVAVGCEPIRTLSLAETYEARLSSRPIPAIWAMRITDWSCSTVGHSSIRSQATQDQAHRTSMSGRPQLPQRSNMELVFIRDILYSDTLGLSRRDIEHS